MRFSELGELPVFLELERLDEGSGIETTLINNKAVWHKLCYNNFNTTKLQRAEKRVIASDSEQENGPAKKYKCRSSFQEMPKDCCFFCGEGPLESLHEAATMHLDSRVRKCARDLQDESLLAKLSVGDMVAIDAKYHLQCLVSLYNRASALSTTRKTDESRKVNEGIALAELLAYIDEMRMNADVAPIFKLSDLVKLYSSRLEYLGVEQQFPPSLSNFGKLRHGTKADLLSCLKNYSKSAPLQPDAEVAILDGAVCSTTILQPLAAIEFISLTNAVKVFLQQYIEKQLQLKSVCSSTCSQWDQYIQMLL